MKRPPKREQLDAYAKYTTFKKAYDKVNEFLNDENYLAAFVLSFSILEDRLTAAFCVCRDSLNFSDLTQNVAKLEFKKKVDRLLEMGAIDTSLRDRLLSCAADRNRLTHEMMWNLDVFEKRHITQIKKLINEVKRCQRLFLTASLEIK
jgi:hypothetical protein